MLTIDVLCLISLAILAISWWMRGLPQRRLFLAVASFAVIAVAIVGLFMNRWQLLPGAALGGIVLLALGIQAVRGARERIGVPWLSGPLVTIWSLFIAVLIYLFPVDKLPAPEGEHPVGVLDFELTDESRMGVLGAAADAPRRLLVRVWYPAETIEGLTPRPYFTEQEAATTATGIGTLIGAPFFFTYTGNVVTDSYENAPYLASESPRPVIIYSHGYTSFLGQNTLLMEELASHGYLVFSVQHPYDASPTVFPNGDVLPIDPEIIADMQDANSEGVSANFLLSMTAPTYEERRQAIIDSYQEQLANGDRIVAVSADVWVQDRVFVLDQLAAAAVPAPVKSLVDNGDFEHTGQMGMSFGGSTTGALCMFEKRCVAAINLDGGDFHFTPHNRNIPVPFMMFYSDFEALGRLLDEGAGQVHAFNDFSYERHETAGLRDDVYRFKTADLMHMGISDFTWFMRNPARGPLLGSIDSETVLNIQNDFVRGFFDHHLLKQDNNFPEAQLKQYEQWTTKNDVTGVRQAWLDANPIDKTVRVVMETSHGEIDIALYPGRAPISAGNFLKHVEAGNYDGAEFYRATHIKDGKGISVVQGGLAGGAMTGAEDVVDRYTAMGSIEHETTSATGIPNERGTIAWARFAPGTAGTEFFFNVDDNPGLDTGNTDRNRDGAGYATFGRVLKGMSVLQAIQKLPTDRPTTREAVQGQLLTEPVAIQRVYRVDGDDLAESDRQEQTVNKTITKQ